MKTHTTSTVGSQEAATQLELHLTPDPYVTVTRNRTRTGTVGSQEAAT